VHERCTLGVLVVHAVAHLARQAGSAAGSRCRLQGRPLHVSPAAAAESAPTLSAMLFVMVSDSATGTPDLRNMHAHQAPPWPSLPYRVKHFHPLSLSPTTCGSHAALHPFLPLPLVSLPAPAFCPWICACRWINPLMNWTSTSDPLENVGRSALLFHTFQLLPFVSLSLSLSLLPPPLPSVSGLCLQVDQPPDGLDLHF
jgi:hypothetical protein